MILPATTPGALQAARNLETLMLTLPQPVITTAHVLHAGVYSRTIKIPAWHVLVGAHITIPTTLTVCGHVLMTIGEESVALEGYYVLAAPADRKQVFMALDDTMVTMAFATTAETVEEAEEQFTNQASMLLSRRGINYLDKGGAL